ncbi:MAG: hypothetical protein HY855_25590 [Burkholderiales bacterium]|nr:hypothetical protein [Burkholderiales bacterium]
MRSNSLLLWLATATLLLASCGGGREAGESARAPLQQPSAAVADAAECRREAGRPPSLLSHRELDGQCLRSFTGFGTPTPAAEARRRVQAVSNRSLSVTELFDWAERTYPQYLPSHQANRTLGIYTYRYYPESQNHLAVAGETIYVQGPLTGGSLHAVGTLTEFVCQVFPDSCSPDPKPCNAVPSWTVGSNTCTPNSDQTGPVNSGISVSYVDSTGSTRGTATYSCLDGSLTVKGTPTCEQAAPLACNTEGLSWTVATNTCVANPGEPTQLASGETHVFRASSGKVGSASYSCTNGVLSATAVPACDIPTPVTCPVVASAITWTVGGNACVADTAPVSIPGGGSFLFTDSTGTPTGAAIFTCTASGMVQGAGAYCDPVPHILDSFGLDGGAADGGASGDGSAGDGAPIVGGLVKVVDTTGKQVTATTNSVGYFRVKLTGMVPPLVVSVTRPDGRVRYSLSTQPLKINGYIFIAVTGLTDKIASDVARAAGFPGASSLTPAMVAAHPAAVAAAINAVLNDGLLHELFVAAGVNTSTFNPLSTPFRTDGTGYDQVLDNIVVSTDATGATVVRSITCQAPTAWTVNGVTCTPDKGEETVMNSGTSIIHKDTSGPTIGSVGYSCQKGALLPPILPSCQVSTQPPPPTASSPTGGF